MKKFIVLVALICMVSLFLAPVSASEEGTENLVKLSMLGEEERAEFLSSMNIVIPEELKNIDILAMISTLEENPNATCAISYTKAAELFEDVRAAVKKYYGIQAEAKVHASSRYALQYSTLYSWNTNMENYNCYAYALGRIIACDPGDFSGQQYVPTANIVDVAAVVKADLNGTLGYDCVKMQNSRPTSSSGWTNVIAVRKDTTGDYYGFNDYHFAKLSSSSWLHKPGRTAVLKFNSAPINSLDWTNEAYNGSVYSSPFVWYDSNIIYLLYKTNHGNTIYEWTGNHYHSGGFHYYEYAYTCQDCGGITETVLVRETCFGPPCVGYMKASDSLEIE